VLDTLIDRRAKEAAVAEHGKSNISVTVVVSGEDVIVTVNTHEHVRELVREALRESGNAGQPPENWVLQGDAGEIDQELTIAAAGIVDGARLSLTPDAGEGGS
jgi:uncharacterized protein YqeY